MAASGSDTTTDEDASAYFISPRRKFEILGLVLMVLALLLSLAFLSYHAEDRAVLRSVEVGEVLLNPQSAQPEVPVQNILGIVGAHLARALVPGFIG
ncbi:MAG: DNA translocase FtsK 4TM domain-containing protein, partial [Salinibacter sp.]